MCTRMSTNWTLKRSAKSTGSTSAPVQRLHVLEGRKVLPETHGSILRGGPGRKADRSGLRGERLRVFVEQNAFRASC